MRGFRAAGRHTLCEEFHVLAEALVTVRGAVRARDLGACEAHFLDQIGPRGRAVDRAALLGHATEQRPHGFVAQLAQQVPDREVDGGDGLQGQALAPVVNR